MKNFILLSKAGLSLRTKIKIYQRRALEIEAYLSRKPDEWHKFQKEFNTEVDNIFRDILEFEKSNNAEEQKGKVKKLKKFFIKRFRKIFMRGTYGPWSITKPLGYPGDYKIIDDIYRNVPSTSGFDRLFDNYFMMSTICKAVRNRKEDFKYLILDFIKNRRNQPVRIMDLACGSCRDVKEMLESDTLICKNVIFDCYDREKRALEYAKGLLNGFTNVNLIQKDILEMCTAKEIEFNIKERYDFIYSTGFFDYLGHRTCVKLIKNLKCILNKAGFLAISNVRDKYSNPSVHYMEWAGDWNLVYRDDGEFKRIFLKAGFHEDGLKTQFEQKKVLQYIIATKNEEES